jgi:hypothetical protein
MVKIRLITDLIMFWGFAFPSRKGLEQFSNQIWLTVSVPGPHIPPCLSSLPLLLLLPPTTQKAMLHLNHDAWAAIGLYMDPVSVFQLSSTCRDLHSDISSNNALWRALARKRWPTLLSDTITDTVRDWHGLYKASHLACCQVG